MHFNREKETLRMRFVAWNVEYGFRADAEEIGEFLKEREPDVVCFSEVPRDGWTERAGKALGMEYSFAGNISSAGHKDKYKSILSRTPLSDKKEFFINGAWTPASVVRAVVEVESFRISVYSLHINGPHADDIVARILPQDDAPYIVVTGDFNNVQGSPVMNLFVDAGFSDALESIGADRGKFTCFFTENGVIEYTGSDASAGKSGGVGGVIDHIIFNRPRKTRVIAGGIIETEKPLSDHKPVWADMEFR